MKANFEQYEMLLDRVPEVAEALMNHAITAAK